jgi:thiamine biosynthesis lipoprotein
VAELEKGSICGSAGNRRKWGKFHHIMHPETKKSVENILAVWVIAENGLLADGLATALFFVEPERLEKDFNFYYCILKNDYSIRVSPNFPGEFY